MLGIDEAALTALARNEIVPSMKVGHRTILYDPQKVSIAFSTAVKGKLSEAGMDTRKLKKPLTGEDLRALGLKPSFLIRKSSAGQLVGN